MKDITTWAAEQCELSQTNATQPKATDAQFLKEVAAEAIGWQPLEDGAYLHAGAGVDAQVIYVVGMADISMGHENVLLLNW